MPHLLKDFVIVSLIVAMSLGFLIFGLLNSRNLSQISSVLPLLEQAPSLPDGTLIKAQDDERVYYIEKNRKRWIESKEASRIQGFKSENVQILSSKEINQYPDGEPITTQSYIVLPKELDTLPDLAPLSIKALQLKKLNGRTILKFTASFWNQGRKHFELATSSKTETKNDETHQEVHQPIAQEDGTYRNRVVGNFSWHIPHKHYHYSDFADYVFSFVRPLPGEQTRSIPKTIRQKTTFCIRDNEPLSLTIPGASQKAVFPTCGQNRQGISVGWIDIYKNTLPDQYIDIHDMPPGVYSLSFLLDPNKRFIEERKDNNISTIFINLDPKKNTAKIIAAAAPFTTSLNIFSDETIVRAGGEGQIYTIHNNKKRPISNSEIFNSYSYSWNNVLILTQSMVDSIPPNNLVRLKDTEKVYILNNSGYKRHLLSPEVFHSYNFKTADIADINKTEFESYPESNLIRLTGSEDIYVITSNSKKNVESVETAQSLGYNLDSIHTINETDFNSYTLVP